MHLALALAGAGAPPEWRDAHDEVAWFTDKGTPVAPDPAETDGNDLGAGIGRAAVGPYTVWLKAGSGPSHGHADLSSVAIAYEGIWLIGDPGTGTYNGPIEQRNYFRSSAAHNVVRVEGEDQLEPHRVFRWKHTARGILGEAIRRSGSVTMWSAHDAYSRLDPARRVARVVTVSESAVYVQEAVEGSPTPLDVSLSMGPDCTWDAAESLLAVAGERFRVEPPCAPLDTGQDQMRVVDIGWSKTYGDVAPTTVLRYRSNDAASLEWSIRLADRDSGHTSEATPESAISFQRESVTLRMGASGSRAAHSISLPGRGG